MGSELLDHYKRASAWTADLVKGARAHLEGSTPCDDWNVRTLLNHMLETSQYFVGAARGEDATPPGQSPTELVGEDPVAVFDQMRDDVIETFGEPGVIEKTGPALGIAFADQLLHGWDLAKATGQDATMPDGLAEAAYNTIHGRFTEEQRKGVFKPEVDVAPNATPQERLLAYTGRDPSR